MTDERRTTHDATTGRFVSEEYAAEHPATTMSVQSHADADADAELQRLREHSVLLNELGWRMAEALGDVEPGQTAIVADERQQLERLIARAAGPTRQQVLEAVAGATEFTVTPTVREHVVDAVLKLWQVKP